MGLGSRVVELFAPLQQTQIHAHHVQLQDSLHRRECMHAADSTHSYGHGRNPIVLCAAPYMCTAAVALCSDWQSVFKVSDINMA